MKRGETVYRSDGTLLALVWQDKKPVKMLSTFHRSTKIAIADKKHRDGSAVIKPRCVEDHNNGMGGVDRSDQLASCHNCVRKFVKWYKKLFLYIFDLCLVNGFRVFKELRPDVISRIST